jgi:hypothetical protein
MDGKMKSDDSLFLEILKDIGNGLALMARGLICSFYEVFIEWMLGSLIRVTKPSFRFSSTFKDRIDPWPK